MKTHRVADVNLNDFEHKNQSTGQNEAMSEPKLRPTFLAALQAMALRQQAIASRV